MRTAAGRARTSAAAALAACLALLPAVGTPDAALAQAADQAAGGGGDAAGMAPTPDSVVVPDSAVVTGARLDDLTARVAGKLRCPVCRNQSVLESSSTLAREMQAEIKRRLAVGESPEEVKAYFVGRYGEWILLKPKAEGINLLVYLFPVLAVLGGGLVVWRLLDSWTGGGVEEPEVAAAGDEGDDTGLSESEEERLASVLEEETGRGD